MKQNDDVPRWSADALREIAGTDEILVLPDRDDGKPARATRIWCVTVDGALYARGYNGTDSKWYRAATRQQTGTIRTKHISREITFEPVEGPINDRIDDAYRTKYRGSAYLAPMISARARAATVQISPRRT